MERPPIHLVLLFFAQARERAGCATATLALPHGSTVADAARAIAAAYPALAPLWPHLVIAMDGQIVRDGVPVRDGAELALLPPVSGGSGAGGAGRVDG